jgi:antitoxin FitA
MGSITIRNVDDEIKKAARLEAVKNGRSMEEELRALLKRTYSMPNGERAARLRAMSGTEFVDHLIKTANGAILEHPERRIDKDREIFGAD